MTSGVSPSQLSSDGPIQALLRELEAALAMAAPEEIPEALVGIERARGRALERLVRTPAAPQDEKLLTMEEVAARLSIKLSRARDLGRRGEIPTVIVGERYVRVRRKALEDWIKRREAGGRTRR
jgi:excisionase family DNA binding protein